MIYETALKMNTVLLTGASGFIGRKVTTMLRQRNYEVRSVFRFNNVPSFHDNRGICCIENLDAQTKWSCFLNNINSVIHLAAQVHQAQNCIDHPLKAFRQINVEGTINLAKQAAHNGVKRFVFMSSIKVNGELTGVGAPFTETDPAHLEDPYAISKWEAEQGLMKIAQQTGLQVVIIRPALVYGPNVKANFLRLLRWVDSGVPLPFGSIDNKRSFVFLDNLVSLIVHALEHPRAANQVFLAADGEDLSTSELLRRLYVALGKTPRLMPVPQRVLELCLITVGKKGLAHRLCGSLQVDISKACNLLSWHPPFSVDHGLQETAAWYQRERKKAVRQR